MKQCLFCYKENNESEDDFHRSCSRKIFGSARPPIFDYGLDEMNELAKQVVERSVTVPGVQAKISLHLNREKSKPDRLTLVGLWGEYILKPPAEKYAELPGNEDLTMHLAEIFRIPLQVPTAGIITRNSIIQTVTTRSTSIPLPDLN